MASPRNTVSRGSLLLLALVACTALCMAAAKPNNGGSSHGVEKQGGHDGRPSFGNGTSRPFANHTNHTGTWPERNHTRGERNATKPEHNHTKPAGTHTKPQQQGVQGGRPQGKEGVRPNGGGKPHSRFFF